MAIHIHNTPSGVDEPALPRAGLLRSRGAPCRILSHGEMLALLDGEKPELPPEALLAADVPHGGARRGCDIATPELSAADLARTRHARRALYEAFDHGLALGDALGLSPFALDLIDEAIEFMDAVDAPHEDLEPDVGYDLPEGDDERCASDQVDGEPSLASPENHENQTSWARGGDYDRELDDADLEDGDEDGDLDDPLMAVRRPPAFLWGMVYVD